MLTFQGVEVPPETAAALGEAERMEALLGKVHGTLLAAAGRSPTLSLRLDNYTARLLARQDHSPTVAAVRLGEMVNPES